MREISVPETVCWGAQTGRSLTYFAIEEERLPIPFIYAFALQKREATLTNIEDNIS